MSEQKPFTTRTMRFQAKPASAALAAFLSGAALGSLLTYLADPHQGARRRAELRDRALSSSKSSSRRALKLGRHVRNQLEGVVSFAADLLRPDGATSDRKLVDRIRSTLGHSVEHLSAIQLEVRQGDVTVRGRAAEGEIPALLAAISRVRGVRSVTDHVERGTIGSSAPIQ